MKEEAEKAERLGSLKSRLESEFGPGLPPPSVEEAKGVIREILKSDEKQEIESRHASNVSPQDNEPPRATARSVVNIAAAAQLDELI